MENPALLVFTRTTLSAFVPATPRSRHRPVKSASFFAESRPDGAPSTTAQRLPVSSLWAPGGRARQTLAEDYQRIVEDGLLARRRRALRRLAAAMPVTRRQGERRRGGTRMRPCPAPKGTCRQPLVGWRQQVVAHQHRPSRQRKILGVCVGVPFSTRERKFNRNSNLGLL
jgi:hypothetical protein